MKEYTTLRNINRGYMKLEVWQKAMDLYQMVHNIVNEAKMDFKIRSQIDDAALSVPSNIAEGYSRRSIREYIQFLYIALASLSETLTRAIGMTSTSQIGNTQFQEIDKLHYEVENRLLRLIEVLEKKRDAGNWIDHIAEDLTEYNP